MLRVVLSGLVIISGALAVVGEYVGPRLLHYVFKPLTTILIFAIAVAVGWQSTSAYKFLIFAGLLFSLAGDIFLMLPRDRFIAGLVSFLLAQICYIAAFASGKGLSLGLPTLIPFLVYGALVYALLAPHLGKMQLPVLIYMLVILGMAWRAQERWSSLRTPAALLGFIGAVLFVISDTILAMNRFRGQFPAARALTLVSYYAAQWLIANSIS